MKKTGKKRILSATVVLSVLVVAGILGYFIYGSTLLDISNEESIINHLSKDKDNPINILSTLEYGDSFLILYTDPTKTEENKNSSYFSAFTKHKYYKNKYKYSVGTTGEQTVIMVSGIELISETKADDKRIYAIANTYSHETKCSILEVDLNTGKYIGRLDIIDVPQDKPYIMVKEYETQKKDSELIAYDGIIEPESLNAEY